VGKGRGVRKVNQFTNYVFNAKLTLHSGSLGEFCLYFLIRLLLYALQFVQFIIIMIRNSLIFNQSQYDQKNHCAL